MNAIEKAKEIKSKLFGKWISYGYKSRAKGALKAKAAVASADQIIGRIHDYKKPAKKISWLEWKRACQVRQLRGAYYLAKQAGMFFDEHGGWGDRGDFYKTFALDFVPAEKAKAAPFCDMGGRGLGLIQVERERRYAKSSQWRPSTASTFYLVGRNESGSFFAHAVPKCSTVFEALEWIWGGQAGKIVQRQGDIALISGSGPKMPSLPSGHVVQGQQIIHDQHPALPLPGKGQRIIVGRRAFARVSEETRD